jgi:hypothetical protein
VTYDVEIEFMYPDGRRLIILPRKSITFIAGVETTITSNQIQANDPLGSYALTISLYNPGGALIEQGSLSLNVLGISWELLLAVIIVVAAAIVALILVRRRIPARKPVITPTPAIGTVEITSPGTVQIQRGPEGTITLLAMLQAGSQHIPISSLPQPFGREDFAGLAPDNILAAISRRGKPQFTISYDYTKGTFLIEDSSSANGTLLNGVEIKGKGPQPLKDGDIIGPARGAIQLNFVSREA